MHMATEPTIPSPRIHPGTARSALPSTAFAHPFGFPRLNGQFLLRINLHRTIARGKSGEADHVLRTSAPAIERRFRATA